MDGLLRIRRASIRGTANQYLTYSCGFLSWRTMFNLVRHPTPES